MNVPEDMDNDGAMDGEPEGGSDTASRFRVADDAAEGVTVSDVDCADDMDRLRS